MLEGLLAVKVISGTAAIFSLVFAILISLMLVGTLRLTDRSIYHSQLVFIVIPALAATICLIIVMVSANVVLSLGLIGALSIVRYRTPIREPRELAYYFVAIAVGIGCGINEPLLAFAFQTIICGFLLAIHVINRQKRGETIFKAANSASERQNITVSSAEKINLADQQQIIEVVTKMLGPASIPRCIMGEHFMICIEGVSLSVVSDIQKNIEERLRERLQIEYYSV